MKKILPIIFISIIQNIYAQTPPTFFNKDCQQIVAMISRIRQHPTKEDFDNYPADSVTNSPLKIDYAYCEIAKNELAKNMADEENYYPPSAEYVTIVSAMVVEGVLANLIDDKFAANLILNTSKKVGLYITRKKKNNRDVLYMFFYIPKLNAKMIKIE